MKEFEEIRRTIARYSTTCDDGKFDEFASLFTDDAEFEVMGQIYRGRDEIVGFMRAAQPPEQRGRHVTTNSVLDLDPDAYDRSRAYGSTDYLFVTRDGAGGYAITNVGRYHDEFTRGTDGEWRFARRAIVFLDPPPT